MLCDLMLGDWKNNTDDAPLFPKINHFLKMKQEGATDEEVRQLLTPDLVAQMRHYLEDFEENPLLSGSHSIPFEDVPKFQDKLRTAQKFSLTPSFSSATLARLATPETVMKAREWFALIHNPMWLEWTVEDMRARFGALVYSKPTATGDSSIMCYFAYGTTHSETKQFELFHFRFLPDSLRHADGKYQMDIENVDGKDIDEVRWEHACIILIFDFIVRMNSKRITEFRPAEDLSRINKKRLRLGKLPLCEYHVVDLNKEIKQYLKQVNGDVVHGVRFHWRRGHFKIRKTGIFWWNPHTAGRIEQGEIQKEYTA
jgi:hypothetical protein